MCGVFLSGQKTGGQELVGGLDCLVHRNFFGSQVILSIWVIPLSFDVYQGYKLSKQAVYAQYSDVNLKLKKHMLSGR